MFFFGALEGVQRVSDPLTSPMLEHVGNMLGCKFVSKWQDKTVAWKDDQWRPMTTKDSERLPFREPFCVFYVVLCDILWHIEICHHMLWYAGKICKKPYCLLWYRHAWDRMQKGFRFGNGFPMFYLVISEINRTFANIFIIVLTARTSHVSSHHIIDTYLHTYGFRPMSDPFQAD